MSLIISSSLVLGAEEDALPDGTPLIGWENMVTTSNLLTQTSDEDFPSSNLANPSTNLKWVGTIVNDEYIIVNVSASGHTDEIDYMGIARHNFGSGGIPIRLEGGVPNTYQKVMLHFDGADGSTTITDGNAGGSAHTWTANGNAQIDTADSIFGDASLLCDGTGDYVSMSDHADLTLGSGDFTFRCWFKINTASAADGTTLRLFGQNDSAFTPSTISFVVRRANTNFIVASVFVGSTEFNVTSAMTFTNSLNTGWHNLEFVRAGNTLKLFIDGDQTGGDVAISGSVNDSTNEIAVGRSGEATTATWNGWIDEFEVLVGVAAHTEDFVVQGTASNNIYWTTLVEDTVVGDDSPIIMQFTPQVVYAMRLWMMPGSEVPEAAVVYVGKLLIMERSFDLANPHIPINYGRRSKSATGFSESGNFLGRVVTQQHRESKGEFKWITPAWYRSHMDEFIAASKTTPFFWAWNPDEYPLETGYCWMTNDPMPETDPATRRISIVLEFRGVT